MLTYTFPLKTLARNLDKGKCDGCAPTKYAVGPKLRGTLNIIDERIKIQNIPDHLKHCMELPKIEFNEGENFKLKRSRPSKKGDIVW